MFQRSALLDWPMMMVAMATTVKVAAVNGPITYYVTQDAHLLAVDTQTGELLGQMQFTPVFPADFDFSNNVIIVAAANDVVAVYFPDQQ